ncbi:MAG: cellulase family glycosylhydrolase [Xanthobacteraceae bacterium]
MIEAITAGRPRPGDGGRRSFALVSRSRLVVVLILGVIAACGGVVATGIARRSSTAPGANAIAAALMGPHGVRERPIPATLFGMHTMGLVDRLPIPFGAQAKSTGTAWPYIETARGIYDWSTEDAAVAVATANRVAPPFHSSDGIPSWATTDTTTCKRNFSSGALLCSAMMKNIDDWNAFITAFIKRYKGRMIYELWNEPDTNNFLGTVNDMVTISNREHDIIRRIDPTALIIAPSGGAPYLDRFFAAGGTRDVDVVPYHEYNSTPEDVIGTISSIRRVMAKYGLSDKPVWDTEGGWGPIPYVKSGVDDFPGYVARRYLVEWSLGTERLYWYAWNSDRFGTLANVGNVANPAGIAFGQIFLWMVGATMSSPCAPNDEVWACGFTRRGGYQALAVWDTGGNSSYVVPTNYRQCRDLMGNTTILNPGSTITIGFRPILLENRPMGRSSSINRDAAALQPPADSGGAGVVSRASSFCGAGSC